jgi:predicted secreted protein
MEMIGMFQDQRGKKILLVAHCILNQNSKIDACAYYPGTIQEAAQAVLDANVGIIQLPCPELFCLGLDRQVNEKTARTVESEDTRVAKLMMEKESICLCQSLVNNIIYQIDEYKKHGFQITGLLGVNGSPTCGVDSTWAEDREYEGRGIFIEMLQKEFQNRNIYINMVGIKARDPEHAVETVKRLLCVKS